MSISECSAVGRTGTHADQWAATCAGSLSCSVAPKSHRFVSHAIHVCPANTIERQGFVNILAHTLRCLHLRVLEQLD